MLRRPFESAQYVSIKYSERLAEAGIEPSVGSVGDSYDNALAETVIGLFKTEVIHRRGPWRSFDAVEYATLEWVDWFNNRRLLEPIGNIPPAEAEANYTPTPRESEDPPCQTARSGFYRTDDTARLSGHRIAAKPDRVGSGRVGRSSSGPTCERAGVARRWDELCEAIAKVLLLDDDTIRTWYRLYEEDGIEGLTNFSYEGSACQFSGEQQEKLKAWVATALPRTTRQVGAWMKNEFGVVYEGRSGLIALLHRLGLEYHKPNVIPRKLDEEKQKAFIEGYEKLLNSLGDDEAVLFADAVHPTHAARPVGCWAPSQREARDRADERASTHQHSRRDQPGVRANPDDRGPDHRRRLDDQAAAIDRGTLSDAGAHPCFLGQRALSSCQARAGMVGPAGTTHQAALHPNVLPALEPDRTVMGPHAQKRHSQQVLRNSTSSPMRRSVFCVKRFRGIGRTFVIRSPTISASSTPRISGHDVNGVYMPPWATDADRARGWCREPWRRVYW